VPLPTFFYLVRHYHGACWLATALSCTVDPLRSIWLYTVGVVRMFLDGTYSRSLGFDVKWMIEPKVDQSASPTTSCKSCTKMFVFFGVKTSRGYSSTVLLARAIRSTILLGVQHSVHWRVAFVCRLMQNFSLNPYNKYCDCIKSVCS
jgi:hypothetical protein